MSSKKSDGPKPKQTNIKLCPLCGKPGRMTREDAMPLWVRQELLAIVGDELQVNGQQPSRVAIRICQTCNSTMARKFENPTALILRPLIQGIPTRLTRRQAVTAARWIAKTVLVLHIRDHAAMEPMLSGLYRFLLAQMLETGNPPVGMSVRIGTCGTALDRPMPDGYTATDANPEPVTYLYDNSVLPETVLGTVANFGHLAAEVQLGIPGGEIEAWNMGVQRNDWLVRVWPPNLGTDIAWPPPRQIEQAELRDLKAEWARTRGENPDWRHGSWAGGGLLPLSMGGSSRTLDVRPPH